MKRRHFAIVLVLLAIAVASAAVLYARNLGFSKRPADKQLVFFQSDDWLKNSYLELRGMPDGSWAVFPMDGDQFSTFFQVPNPTGRTQMMTIRSEPPSDVVAATRFLPGIHLDKSGFVVKVIDGEQLWRSSIAPPNPEGFASIPFPVSYTWDPAKISSAFPISGYWYLGHAPHPSLPLIAVVSGASDTPLFPWASDGAEAPLIVEFFSTLDRTRIGMSFELVKGIDGYGQSFQKIQGWTPDGQWLLLTSAGITQGGVKPFSRIWAVSLQMAELEGFAAEQTR